MQKTKKIKLDTTYPFMWVHSFLWVAQVSPSLTHTPVYPRFLEWLGG